MMESGQVKYPENRAMELSDFKARDYFAEKKSNHFNRDWEWK
jgi:hypothetical protein